ncbi:MAG: phosphate ABC transporter permease PstA [Deltaproteobacteria bacterium]|nr:phosphate ABC transporter permease PstA [Deltaproteobacteria bacterium]
MQQPSPSAVSGSGRGQRSSRQAANLLAHGTPMVWLTGGAMTVCLAMIATLLVYVAYQGFATFWPVAVVQVRTLDGRTLMGEVTRHDRFRPSAAVLESLPADHVEALKKSVGAADGWAGRRLIRTGNYELTNEHFNWVSDFEIAADGEVHPPWALIFERMAWGRFYGTPTAFLLDGAPVADEPETVWQQFNQYHGAARRRWAEARELEKSAIGRVNYQLEQARLKLRQIELAHGQNSAPWREAAERFEAFEAEQQRAFDRIQAQIQVLDKENGRYQIQVTIADGREKVLALADIVRAYPANRLNGLAKTGIYLSRWWEFLAGDPREANSEGGVFPAIFGTVVMTLLMSIAVAPFGVLAALYLREYAKAGPVVSAVRIAINNLAGVPSIVFGVFGLGFFSYIIGARIDEWLFAAKLPSPTFGTGGILWASLTLALLTLPVVIVATEEALSAVPNSMREGSYACGASKWQTIQRIVLPRAMPGVMTGMILAMARGAGEVAPLMLVGAVKLAPELPIDGHFPFIHLERSFMHLGFHIYDLGFQSQNSEAAKPMVFTTTLLLIALIFLLNAAGVTLRKHLKRKFASSVF